MSVFSVIGMITVGLIGLVIFLVTLKKIFSKRLPKSIFLTLDLNEKLIDFLPNEPLAQYVNRNKLTLLSMLESLKKASEDSAVKGIIVKVGKPQFGLAKIQEIRDAILQFNKKGKETIVFSESFGESSMGLYYLATAFSKVCLLPCGDLGLTGLSYETPFVKNLLKKIGITPRMDHRCEYKNMLNMFTEESFTAPHKESIGRILTSHFNQIIKGISEQRGISFDDLTSLVDEGPIDAQKALDLKLVDHVCYRDEVIDLIKNKFTKKIKFIRLSDYLNKRGGYYIKGEQLAVIYGVGKVIQGKSEFSPLSKKVSMGSDSVAAAFRAAAKNKKNKAIIFRVDSPGGSHIASDIIWREVLQAKKKGKPVIVSMGDVAGSGGYYISIPANKIIAQPGTLTGSIGVVAGKMLISDATEKVGISWDQVSQGNRAKMNKATHDYSEDEWKEFQRSLDKVYNDFMQKVAKGRGLSFEETQNVAKGRVWTGEDAIDNGLIDCFGGFELAIDLAKKEAKIPEKKNVQLKVYPAKKTLTESLLQGKNKENDTVVSMFGGSGVSAIEEVGGMFFNPKKKNILLDHFLCDKGNL